jgi:thiol-disulfide isomerase/thioredoxin
MARISKSQVFGLLAAAGVAGSVVLGVAAAASPSPAAAEQPGRRAAGPQVGEVAPAWQTVDPEGKKHKLADYKGKIVVMDFWATWCPPCKRAMPGLQKLHEEYKDQGVVVLGMNFAEKSGGDPVGYMKQQKFTYGLMLSSEEVAKAYGVSGIPAFFVVGPDGKVIHRAVGYSTENERQLEEVIKANLDKVQLDGRDAKPKKEGEKGASKDEKQPAGSGTTAPSRDGKQ